MEPVPIEALGTANSQSAGSAGPGGEVKSRVALAFQGGSFLAGAVSAGTIRALVAERIFEDHDVRVFSGTSAGALVATACWSHAMRSVIDGIPFQRAMAPLPELLAKMWLHNAKEFFATVPNQTVGDLLKATDAAWRHLPPWEGFVQNVRAPTLRLLFRQWMREYLTPELLRPGVKLLHDRFRPLRERIVGTGGGRRDVAGTDPRAIDRQIRSAFSVDPELPRLVLGSANVLTGEIMGFREYDVALAVDDAFREARTGGMVEPAALAAAYDAGVARLFEFIEASGSLEEINGSTTIADGPYAGTYYDGAWGQNPPIDDLLDYGVDAVWLVEIFPRERSTLPDTYSERQDRKEELLQNALVEHERHTIDKVNEWIRNGRFITDYAEYEAFLAWKRERGESVAEPIAGADRFQTYRQIAVRRMPMTLDFTPGARIVNWAPFLRDMMRYGDDNARQFLRNVDRR